MAAEQLRRQRGGLRATFTTTYNHLKSQLEEDWVLDRALVAQLKDKYTRLVEKDSEYHETIEFKDDDEFAEEMASCEVYHERMVEIEYAINSKGDAPEEKRPVVQGTIRLPKLELEAFELSCKTWLPFWAQFKRIHEDATIDVTGKFQYLIMSLREGAARDVVLAHPRTEESYRKVIDTLQQRYGRETLLVEVYTRELINILLSKKSRSVSQLYNLVSTQLGALAVLGMTSDKCAFFLYPLVEMLLPTELLRVWERQRRSTSANAEGIRGSSISLATDVFNERNPLDEIMKFLEDEVGSEERISLTKSVEHSPATVSALVSSSQSKPAKPAASNGTESVSNSRKPSSIFCDREHNSQDCIKAQSLTSEQRSSAVSKARACFKCLKRGHTIRDCKAAVRCLLCGKGHHAIVCRATQCEVNDKVKSSNTEVHANFAGDDSAHTYLKTLMVEIVGKSRSIAIRALLDDGAQRSYISQSVIDELKLKPSHTEVITHGLFGGHTEAAKEYDVVEMQLRNLRDKTKVVQINAVTLQAICHQVQRPSALQDRSLMKALADRCISLTDVGENPPPIQCLLGADVLGNILTGRLQVLGNGVTAVETQLGWSVLGTSSRRVQNMVSLSLNVVNIAESWDLEAIGIKEPVIPAGTKTQVMDAVIHLENTIEREDGRYVLQLPWKAGHPPLSENLDVATTRLSSVSTKLKREKIFEKYDEVIQDWLKEGIVEEVPDAKKVSFVHYLPHRPVIKDGESSTKIRPVFDASAKKPGRASLNDCLLAGENMLQLIPPLLRQFRIGSYGLTADVKQAFLQLAVKEKDRDVLRFLWWNGNEIRAYRHCRVVFGVTCSPFLLNFTLAHHLAEEAKQESVENQQLIERLKNSFYVDDSVTSFDEPEVVSKFVDVATEVMSRGRFELRRWTSNAPQLRIGDPRKTVMVLGLKWNLTEDALSCASMKNRIPKGPITKRLLLGLINSVYDPLGFLSPAMLPARMMLQEAWRAKIDWDVPLSEEQQKLYEAWVESIPEMERINIPRHLFGGKANAGVISLHVFSDASQRGYGCCIYARYDDSNGLVTTRLVAAKSRVAPLQATTIPRLELNKSLEGVFGAETPTYFWTDSTTALAWIKKALPWGTYVGNRVKEIRQGSIVENWKFVPGVMNPADVASRRCNMLQLRQMQWWEGPEWLRLEEALWPQQPEIEPTPEAVLELKSKSAVLLSTIEVKTNEKFSEVITRYFSSYLKMIRMVAWILRFRKPTTQGPLSADEVSEAEAKVLWLVQKEGDCHVGVQTSIDDKGLLRVKSRVARSDGRQTWLYYQITQSSSG